MAEYISNTTDVRELTRSVLATDFPDAEIIEEQKAAYNYISIYTHKFDWSPSDPEYYSIQKLEAQLAKCYILEHYGGSRFYEYVAAQKEMVNQALDKIVENLVSPTFEDEELITSTDYKSWILNPDVPYVSKLDPSLRNLDSDARQSDLD